MDRKRGFTLIEISVALAVLLIFAALLFPVISRAREKGCSASCQSNLHQIYLGMVQYVSDNDARFPNVPMLGPMLPYIKSHQVFICPSAPNYAREDDDSDYEPIGNWLHTLTFIPSGHGLPKPKLVGASEEGIVQPDRMILIADHALWKNYREEVPFPRGAACGITLANGQRVYGGTYSTLHSGGLNAAFYDGHVKWITTVQAAEYECESGQFSQPPYRADGFHVAD